MLPLVEPGPALSPERLARYSRQLILPGFDELAQRRLANTRVLVVGAGGLGSASIPYLASAGIGTIGVVDNDSVALSNLHRQIAHGMGDIGRRKVESIADTVAAIDPDVTVHAHDVWLDSENITGILADYDLVLDGSDNFETRYLTNDAAERAGKPLVWGAILRYNGQAGVAWAAHGPTYRDLFPEPPAPGEILSCADGGVLPGVAAIIGAIMATEAVKLITGVGEALLGRVTTYDALTGRYRELEYERAEPLEIRTQVEEPREAGVSKPAARRTVSRRGLVPRPLLNQRGEGNPASGNISATDLSHRLQSGEPLQLIDVREPFEAAIATLDGSELIPLGSLASSLDRVRHDVPVVVYCHHGMRSMQAASILRQAGFDNVENLTGGIEAYAREVDPSLARY
ncbi:ThiF family adenylyltransferase [Leifsonia sp. Root112D2]|uniref:ThiF family adenylyltransferase n=1 Tax=Leifsonia sp. Root112D2 TaxID=1736426 RepID=UPI0006F360AF|nr:ThiF family adenylyltransferase [Leifsonia sp. Root112D2]KQV06156.1 molybdopterin biosynthesis protein MoeB [Leifsonia sp. Root112D2]